MYIYINDIVPNPLEMKFPGLSFIKINDKISPYRY